MLFERLAIDVMLNMDLKNAARLLGLSWDEAHHIQARAVARGLAPRELAPPRVLGVDEKAIAKRHQYGTLLVDVERGCVLEVAKERRKESLKTCFDSLGEGGLRNVEAVAMDMWEPFIQTTREVIERHLTNVLTYFKHRVTNATSEGINAGVQLLSSRARGFRNFAKLPRRDPLSTRRPQPLPGSKCSDPNHLKA